MSKNSEVRSQRLKYEGRRTKEEGRSSFVHRSLILFSVLCFLFSAIGCEAFVRKFTRKPKKEDLPRQEIVAQPEEYKAQQLTKEELYRQYFLYWKSWHDELLEALSAKANHKKQVSCVKEAIKNLEEIRALLNETKQKELDIYLVKMGQLKGVIAGDAYGANISRSRMEAERVRRNVLRDFSYQKISAYLR